jgi:hypothetical protein
MSHPAGVRTRLGATSVRPPRRRSVEELATGSGATVVAAGRRWGPAWSQPHRHMGVSLIAGGARCSGPASRPPAKQHLVERSGSRPATCGTPRRRWGTSRSSCPAARGPDGRRRWRGAWYRWGSGTSSEARRSSSSQSCSPWADLTAGLCPPIPSDRRRRPDRRLLRPPSARIRPPASPGAPGPPLGRRTGRAPRGRPSHRPRRRDRGAVGGHPRAGRPALVAHRGGRLAADAGACPSPAAAGGRSAGVRRGRCALGADGRRMRGRRRDRLPPAPARPRRAGGGAG